MKRLITLHDHVNLESILAYADGVLIGNDQFGTRLCHSFSSDEINQICQEAFELKKDVFVVANQMMTDDELDQFSNWLDELKLSLIKGIVVADLGAIMTLKEKGLEDKAIYNPETLITNHYDFNFLEALNIQGVYAAKEITLDDLEAIGKHKKLNMFMVGHGHLNMFYSKRQLIKNYEIHLEQDLDLHNRQDLRLIEEKRSDEPYPVLEDHAGTHVFRSKVMHVLNHIDLLSPWIDYMVIDTIFKDDRYGMLVSQMYATHDHELKENIQAEYQETWDEGFFYKKTVYKGKGGEQ
jgi:putative protease